MWGSISALEQVRQELVPLAVTKEAGTLDLCSNSFLLQGETGCLEFSPAHSPLNQGRDSGE